MMMAYETKPPPPGAARTFTTNDRDERAARRRAWRLTGKEVQDLRDLWTGVGLALGVRSPHGALEVRLLMAPPRDVGAPLLEELDRRGEWVSEGTLLRIVTREGWGVPSELRRALRRLVRDGKVERRAVVLPDVPPRTIVNATTGEVESCRTNAEQLRIEDWTGFEVRRAMASARLALAIVPLTREERWRRQDEEVEREWRIIHGSESRGTTPNYEPPEDARRAGANRAYSALSKMSERHAEILRTVFGQHHTSDESEVEAVAALVGGDEENARVAIESACKAYREARGS